MNASKSQLRARRILDLAEFEVLAPASQWSIIYTPHTAGAAHALPVDYDEAYCHLSPGTALSFAIVKSLFERRDVKAYDMGPGLNKYKIRWASHMRPTVHLEIYAEHLRARLLYLLETVVIPKARTLRKRLLTHSDGAGGDVGEREHHEVRHVPRSARPSADVGL